MTSSTTRAFMAKKPFATASAFMAKTNQMLSTITSLRLLLVMLLTLSVSAEVWGAEGDVAYTLSCVQNKSNSGYANYYDVTINSKQWNAPGNQTLGAYWRIGGKGLTKVDRTITGKNMIDKPIQKITVNHNGKSHNSLTVHSFTITVATDASFSQIVETKQYTPSISTNTQGSFDLTPNASIWASGCYYKFTINVSNSSNSSNYGFDLTSIVFYEGATTPSCTNPTVSWSTAPANGNVGGTMTAKANTNYPAGLTYSSSDPSVATIDASGLIEYLKVGSTTITASVRGDGTTYCNETVSVSKTITVTCGSKVTINTTNDGHGTITASPTSIETCSDNDEYRKITITLKPNSHYSSNAPTISGIANATITGSGNTYTVQLPKSSNGTLNISATFKEDEKYTVTWSADGTPIKTQEVYVNEQVSEVPTSSDIPEENRCGDKFVGWTTEAIPTPQDGAPDYFTTVANSPAITDDITFHAVFADYK